MIQLESAQELVAEGPIATDPIVWPNLDTDISSRDLIYRSKLKMLC